ncbi:hypothetical protein HK102_011429, partial [Quaeritorhiza haematococci]
VRGMPCIQCRARKGCSRVPVHSLHPVRGPGTQLDPSRRDPCVPHHFHRSQQQGQVQEIGWDHHAGLRSQLRVLVAPLHRGEKRRGTGRLLQRRGL